MVSSEKGLKGGGLGLRMASRMRFRASRSSRVTVKAEKGLKGEGLQYGIGGIAPSKVN